MKRLPDKFKASDLDSGDSGYYAHQFAEAMHRKAMRMLIQKIYHDRGFKTAEGQKLAFELDEVKRRAFERIAKERADISCGDSIALDETKEFAMMSEKLTDLVNSIPDARFSLRLITSNELTGEAHAELKLPQATEKFAPARADKHIIDALRKVITKACKAASEDLAQLAVKHLDASVNPVKSPHED
ncbi:hypothetical protein GC174_14835 [bacterium]|nr:hypothetical protein [bacterium]